ncbi:MAG: hypothetical protein AB7L13_16095 [Acidimicrobiia bacterium]
MRKSVTRVAALGITLAIAAAACGDDSSDESSSSATTAAAGAATTAAASATTAAGGAATTAASAASRKGKTAAELYTTDLSKSCPSPIIVQKDWLAEVEHAAVYQLIGDKGKMSESTYEGPLGSTGVNLKIIDGGPGLGTGQTVISSLTAGNLKFNVTPHLAFVSTDDAAIFSKQFPIVGVVGPLDKSPQMLFWDPATYPKGFKTIQDLVDFSKTGNKIYVGSIKQTYGKFLVDSGVPASTFLEGYAGDAEKFVTNGGKWINQGYASNEVYDFEHGRGWAKPLAYTLVNDLGYDFYPSVISVSKSRLAELTPCLQKLVPLIQQAQVDYANDPTTVNKVIFEYNDKKMGASFWKTPIELNQAGHTAMLKDKLIGNGSDATLGNFDLTRVQKTIDTIKKGFDDRANPAVTANDIVTNQFIDTSIGLK